MIVATSTTPSLKAQARVILDRGRTRDHHSLVELVAGAIDETRRNVLRKVAIYKYSGFFLLVAIPLLSTLLSIHLGMDRSDAGGTAILASAILSLFTILNSIFQPRNRFHGACALGIKLDCFAASFLFDLETKSETWSPERLAEYCMSKLEELERFRFQLIDLFLPESLGEDRSQKGPEAERKK